jgi:CSLREA domain-containing protein
MSIAATAARLMIISALFVGVASRGIAAPSAPSNIFNVTKFTDDNGACDVADCALREAIRAANATTGSDTIVLPAGTYLLTISGSGENNAMTGDLDIKGEVTINGAGAALTVIDANFIDRGFHIVQESTPVTITNVTIQNGSPPLSDVWGGGGIFNDGNNNAATLTLVNTIVQNNVGYQGGGISNRFPGQLKISGSSKIISNGDADDTIGGGGIYSNGPIEITSSSIEDNLADNGAGIYGTEKATMILENMIFDGNIASGFSNAYGGGIYNDQGIILKNASFRNNQATFGAGIYTNYTANLQNITFNQNSAQNGAAIFSDGSTSLTNVTISNNSATDTGAGIYNEGVLTIVNATLFENQASSAGSIYNTQDGSVSLHNNIIGGSVNGNCFTETLGGWTSRGYNMEDGDTCLLSNPTDLPNTANLKIGPLADNGGPTVTHALQNDSPAVDAGDPRNCPAIDQRQRVRPVDGDIDLTPICDIGAFELEVSGFVAFSPTEFEMIESNTVITLTVIRYGSDKPISVDYSSVTLPRSDFLPVQGILSWANGNTAAKKFSITILDDHFYEGDEAIIIALSNLVGGVGIEYPNNLAAILVHDNEDSSAPREPADIFLPLINR